MNRLYWVQGVDSEGNPVFTLARAIDSKAAMGFGSGGGRFRAYSAIELPDTGEEKTLWTVVGVAPVELVIQHGQGKKA